MDISSNPQYGEQINLVKDLQKKIIDLQMDQHKSEKAIVDHELSRHVCLSLSAESSSHETSDAADQVEDGSPMKGDFGTAYTLRQAKLNEELQV